MSAACLGHGWLTGRKPVQACSESTNTQRRSQTVFLNTLIFTGKRVNGHILLKSNFTSSKSNTPLGHFGITGNLARCRRTDVRVGRASSSQPCATGATRLTKTVSSFPCVRRYITRIIATRNSSGSRNRKLRKCLAY